MAEGCVLRRWGCRLRESCSPPWVSTRCSGIDTLHDAVNILPEIEGSSRELFEGLLLADVEQMVMNQLWGRVPTYFLWDSSEPVPIVSPEERTLFVSSRFSDMNRRKRVEKASVCPRHQFAVLEQIRLVRLRRPAALYIRFEL